MYFYTAQDVFLLVSMTTNLSTAYLDTPELHSVVLPVENKGFIGAVDVYPETDSVFWTDIILNTINTAKRDVSILT